MNARPSQVLRQSQRRPSPLDEDAPLYEHLSEAKGGVDPAYLAVLPTNGRFLLL